METSNRSLIIIEKMMEKKIRERRRRERMWKLWDSSVDNDDAYFFCQPISVFLPMGC